MPRLLTLAILLPLGCGAKTEDAAAPPAPAPVVTHRPAPAVVETTDGPAQTFDTLPPAAVLRLGTERGKPHKGGGRRT